MDGWTGVNAALPADLVMSIGNLAIAFATVDVQVSLILSRGMDAKSSASIHRRSLGAKLELFGNQFPHYAECAARINTAAETRNDLMHGYIMTTVWSSVPEAERSHYAINFGAYRTRTLRTEDLDGIANEAIVFARVLGDII